MLCKYLLYLLLAALFSPISPAQVLINEFMAENVTTDADIVDYDDYSDWIELYNTQNSVVDLTGYYLTDNINDPLKWQIPSGASIPAHGFLMFRADGFDAGPGKRSYRLYWPWGAFTTVRYHTNFKLDISGEQLALFKTSGQGGTSTLISSGSEWKYLDDGSNQGTGWRSLGFNDASWRSGYAQLGYGDGDETTTVGYGSDSQNKYITTYFRKVIQVTNKSNITALTVNLLHDDGAVVYVNGTEVLRTDLPSGDITYLTLASSAMAEPDENLFTSFTIPVSALVQGDNIIAVEMHQSSAQSSDLGFDMQLNAEAASGSLVELVDSVTFGYQLKDVSMGRNPNDNYNWYYYGEATPGSVNTGAATHSQQLSGGVSFSSASGFYSGQVSLSITKQNSDEEIYYTIDGSIPDSKSLHYNSPIIITRNTVVRARAIAPGKLPGNVSSNSYFINETRSNLPVVSVTVDSLTMWDNTVGMYSKNFKGREIPVAFEYLKTDGISAFNVNAGMRLGGYNSWQNAQKPLNLYFRSRYGNDLLNYQLFSDKPVTAFTSIDLRDGGDNWSNSFINDMMTQSVAKGQIKNGLMAYTPCIVYLNGRYWGIHDIRDRYDQQYFASNFNIDATGYDYLGYSQTPPNYQVALEVFEGTADNYNSFLSYVSNTDFSVKANYDSVCKLMDIKDFIDYISYEEYIANTSWPWNRESWRAPHGDGKWRWLLQDLDRGFTLSNVNSNILHAYNSDYPVFRQLIRSTEFRNRFVQELSAHLNSTFSSDRIAHIVDSLQNQLSAEMPRHIQRWRNEGGIQSMAAWQTELNNIKQFADQRTDIVFDQVDNEFSLQGTSELSINLSAQAGGKFLINGVPLCGGLTGMRFFRNIPMEITALANPGFVFAGWGNGNSNKTITLTIQSDTVINTDFVVSGDIILPNVIDVNTTLTNTANVYRAASDIKISSGAILYIGKGVNIRMSNSSGIYVEGNLVIDGTEEEPVVIMPDTTAGADKWGALCFANAQGKNLISHLIIRGATTGNDPLLQKAAISSINSDVEIDHILIEEVSFPIFALHGSMVLKNSVLHATGTCDYIGIRQGTGLVENNTFYGNKSPDTDAIDFDGDNYTTARGNRIYNFRGFNNDAIDIGEECKNILVTGNVIYNSFDKGISVGQLSEVTIEKNVIVDCDMGVAVKDLSHAVIVNNTFYGNNHAVACYEKNYGLGGGFADVKNSILASSRVKTLFVDSLSAVTISYSYSDMENLSGEHNLFGDPLFTDAVNFNYQLKAGSPCSDKADPASGNDPDGTLPDIGAYYAYNENDIAANARIPYIRSVVVNEIMYNDGDINSKDWIELFNSSNDAVDLNGWTLSDQDVNHIYSFPQGVILAPRSFIVVCRNSGDFADAYPGVTNYIGDLDFAFDGNDDVRLYNNSGTLVNKVSYNNSDPWPSAPDGNGSTLELRDPYSYNFVTANWSASSGPGTPGRQNSIYNPANVNQPELIPTEYRLDQNYPNPFNPVTNIAYSIPSEVRVRIKIFDILGREVLTLLNEVMPAGKHVIQLNGYKLSSGIYFYSIEAGKFVKTMKCVLLK